jgi:ABC-type nitrate/sulfonate/bicarbonate transport system substrate-binding protein
MKKIYLLLTCLFLSACTSRPAATVVPPVATETSSVNGVVIRFSYPISPGIGDIPFLMTMDVLKEKGYDVQTTQLARFELNITALSDGDLDIVSGGTQAAWAAIAEGAPMRTIVGRLVNTESLVTKTGIAACADLAGKNIAISGTTSVGTALLTQYISRHCPGTEPQLVTISSSSNRLPALLSGEIDGANLQLDDLLEASEEAPGQYHALVYYVNEFPDLQQFAFHVSTDFAGKNPQAVMDFVRALLEAQRTIQDKQLLKDAAIKYLEIDEAQAETQASTYLEHGAWSVNGGLTDENVQLTLDFLVEAGVLSAGQTPKDVSDLSYLNAILDEIGRQ